MPEIKTSEVLKNVTSDELSQAESLVYEFRKSAYVVANAGFNVPTDKSHPNYSEMLVIYETKRNTMLESNQGFSDESYGKVMAYGASMAKY